jgi:hypothetical protein
MLLTFPFFLTNQRATLTILCRQSIRNVLFRTGFGCLWAGPRHDFKHLALADPNTTSDYQMGVQRAMSDRKSNRKILVRFEPEAGQKET